MSGRKRIARIGLLLAMTFLLLGAGDEEARFNSLGHRMMCVCGCNQVLLECNHVGCTYSDRMRGELVNAVQRGENDSLILQGFVQNSGTIVLLAPSTTGFGQIAWIMPYAALGLGLVAVFFVVQTWKKRPAPLLADGVAPVSGPLENKYREQARKETEL